MVQGTIVKGIGGFYYVDTGEEVLECKARGLFRNKDITPLPGDHVNVEISEPGYGTIQEIDKRETLLVRPAVANVTQLLVVVACACPQPDFLLVDKLLLAALSKNIKPIIVLNKSDLVSSVDLESFKLQYSSFDCIIVSTKNEEGIDKLKEKMTGFINAFAGQSGVGKSSILNSIFENAVMKTGVISTKSSRGKHTTRHAELFKLIDGGFILDTPGFSSYELEDISYEEIWRYYPEMEEVGCNCRFQGCIHTAEPGCMVKKLVDENKINLLRYQRYVHLLTEIKQVFDNRWKK